LSKKHRDRLKNRRKHGDRRKEASRRKREAQEELKAIGLGLEHDTLSLGVIFEDLGISQATFFCINQVNELCRKYAGLNLQFFVQHAMQSCIQPLCPIDNVTTLLSWEHPLIATSVSTCLDALTSKSSIIYHYVFDVDFDTRHEISTSDLLRAFCDPRIRVVTRHLDYRKLVEREFDIQVCEQTFSDFQMAELIQLIVKEMQYV